MVVAVQLQLLVRCDASRQPGSLLPRRADESSNGNYQISVAL